MRYRRWLALGFGLFCVTLFVKKAPVMAQDLFFTPAPNTIFKSFQDEIPAIDWILPLETPEFLAYLSFYSLDQIPVKHYAGYQKVNQEQIFVHALVPDNAKATVMVLHGYFVHSGLLHYLIQSLLEANYAVLALDLPGHGLSGGAKASIDDFSAYSEVINQVSQSAQIHLPDYDAIIGHSTGAAGAWEFLLRFQNQPFKRAVLAAPLVRSYSWELSQVGLFLGQSWLSDLPRLLRETSKDPSFLNFVRQDPLQYDKTPVRWVQALVRWNEQHIPALKANDIPLLIIQGEQDTVVDWKYNIPFLAARFPNHQIKWIPESRHDIFWETESIRNKAFQSIQAFLADSSD